MNIHERSNSMRRVASHLRVFPGAGGTDPKSEVQQQFFTAKPNPMDPWELRGIHRLDRTNIAMNAVILCN